ncbi:hypothetical protein DDE19_14770 [Micromonospora ureilytica]|uniref:Uncharacterized protein n=1 Tax=Micromonospora ureilytica TaxID=709868 RepID=A0A3N9XUL5_9ACTN|nr:hypothetical protein DDE19_14770 [Micromonospora ureilytica]
MAAGSGLATEPPSGPTELGVGTRVGGDRSASARQRPTRFGGVQGVDTYGISSGTTRIAPYAETDVRLAQRASAASIVQ